MEQDQLVFPNVKQSGFDCFTYDYTPTVGDMINYWPNLNNHHLMFVVEIKKILKTSKYFQFVLFGITGIKTITCWIYKT